MKIKVLSRDPDAFSRKKSQDLDRVAYNPNPELHPFERPIEYTRSLNAVKLERLFAKPFVHALSGHRDTICRISRHPTRVVLLASGGADGDIRLWNVAAAQCIYTIENAHEGFVNGLGVNEGGQILSAGSDGIAKLWDVKSPTWVPQLEVARGDGKYVGLDGALDALYEKEGEESEEESEDEIHFDSEVARSSRATRIATKVPARKNLENGNESHCYGHSAYPSHLVADGNGPIMSWSGKGSFTCLTQKRDRGSIGGNLFATSSTRCVQLWDYNRSGSLSDMGWDDMSSDSYTFATFNPIETNILAATSSDRSFMFFDIRSKIPIRKLVMGMKTNSIAWNPMEPFMLTTANENHNLYTFDMRRLGSALHVHIDHTSAVLDVEYSPTGKEFVSGSYDTTVRIFPVGSLHSREIYHTRRMQRVHSVKYSGDSYYVFSGSEDAVIRLWKSNASAPCGIVHPRKRQKLNYQKKLIERYRHMPEIKRIHLKRVIPKAVYWVQQRKLEMKKSAQRKEANIRAHLPAGQSRPPIRARTSAIIEEVK